jgi:hypothetical protein
MCVSTQDRLKHIGTLCEQDTNFLSARRMVYKVTTVPSMFKEDMDLSRSWSAVVSNDQSSYIAYVYDVCWRIKECVSQGNCDANRQQQGKEDLVL